MANILSMKQARKIILLSQHIPKGISHKNIKKATLSVIQRLSYVQIDTIYRVERAHHHTLWNRINGYQSHILDHHQQQRNIFKYWTHAASYLPIEDFRYCRITGLFHGNAPLCEMEERPETSV
ncbi:hypothetical protein HX37_25750 [Salmonella enterica]|uniref:Uncharacterized protein n=1 Tax=Salmonella enterica TaxID=28901 RepID=A0A5U2FBZ2_SALER|nr:hypothetical protein [Salmonella enterica]